MKKLLILGTVLALLAILAVPAAAFAADTTQVTGSVVTPTITVNPPSDIAFGTLMVGDNYADSGASGSVSIATGSANSGNWQVTAQDTIHGGFMYSGVNYLTYKLRIAKDGAWTVADTGITYSGTFDTSGPTPANFTLYAKQPVTNTDAAGNYVAVITFTGTITSYN